MNSHTIKFPKTAHFFTLGEPGEHITDFWLVCHGYGQAAKRFISKFSELEDGKTFILAPEGLSRFYFKGFTGEVGASWMTSEDRLSEIEDYCAFIDLLYDRYLQELSSDVRTHLVGFSQGGATVVRFLANKRRQINNLILWGADIPTDVDYQKQADFFKGIDTYVLVGKNDEYIPKDRKNEYVRFLKEAGLEFKFIEYDGTHSIDRATLSSLARELKLKN